MCLVVGEEGALWCGVPTAVTATAALLLLALQVQILLLELPLQLSLLVAEGSSLVGKGVLPHGEGDVGQLDVAVCHAVSVAGQDSLH